MDLEHLVRQANKVLLEILASREQLELQGQVEIKDPKDKRVHSDLQEQLGSLDNLATKANPVEQERLDNLARLAMPVQWVSLGIEVNQEWWDLSEQLVSYSKQAENVKENYVSSIGFRFHGFLSLSISMPFVIQSIVASFVARVSLAT